MFSIFSEVILQEKMEKKDGYFNPADARNFGNLKIHSKRGQLAHVSVTMRLIYDEIQKND